MKKIKFCIIILISLFVISGCSLGLSKEEQRTAKENEEYAKGQATDYIKKKYQFNAKVIDAESITERNSLAPLYLTGEVIVTMKYNNKKFYVKVNTKENKDVVGDTYQNDVIKKDCIKKLKEIFNQEPIFFSSNYDIESTKYIEYVHDFYNGNNIESYFIGFKAGIINDKTAQEKVIEELEKLLPENNNTGDFLTIYNYKSKKDYEQSKKLETGTYIGEKEAIFLNGYYHYSNNKVWYYPVKIEVDDITLASMDYTNKKIESFNTYAYEKITDKELETISKYDSNKTKTILNAIKLDNKEVNYIYLKKDKYKNYKKLRAVLYCRTKKYYDFQNFKKIGDYYYTHFNVFYCDDSYLLIKTY